MKAGLGSFLVAVLLVAFFFGDDAVDLVTRGKRLTVAPMVNGKVPQPVSELAAAASVVVGFNVNETDYAVARMVRSEDGGGSVLARKLIAHVAYNDAKALGWSMVKLFQFSDAKWANGHFGEQYVPPVKDADGKITRAGAVRRYSTARDPYESDFAIAREVAKERAAGIDLAEGARNFVHKGSFDGKQVGTGSYDALKAKWEAKGLRAREIAGTGDLVLFAKGVA